MTHPIALLTDSDLLDEVLRVAAAADCPLDRAADVTALRSHWHTAPLVLLDPPAVSACLDAGFPGAPASWWSTAATRPGPLPSPWEWTASWNCPWKAASS